MTTMTFKLSLAALALLAAASAQASCYTVLNAKGDIVSQTSTPPVDMALRLDQTVPQRYGAGADMVFGIAGPWLILVHSTWHISARNATTWGACCGD